VVPWHRHFAEWDSEDELNIGPGKRHPGLTLVSSDGRDIPVLFAANMKAPMTSGILKEAFKKMDELGITQQGVDENGTTYLPVAVVDGHISRMGEDFLRYVNDTDSHWEVNLGASYGTEYWQLHDDRKQNGAFKDQLAASKLNFYLKKRLAGLPPEILPCKIVLVARDTIMKLFMNVPSCSLHWSQEAGTPITETHSSVHKSWRRHWIVSNKNAMAFFRVGASLSIVPQGGSSILNKTCLR
jgi:hypothetical protein